MRRKEKEIVDRSVLDDIIRNSTIFRLAMSHNDNPYIVPLNFGYDNNAIYFHSAKAGAKIEILKKNPKVCFEFEGEYNVKPANKPCNWSIDFHSVIGFGKVVFLESREEKRIGLDAIMAQYSNATYGYSDKAIDNVAVLKIKIENIRGKQSKR